MKAKQRLLSLLLAVCLIVGLLPITAVAADTGANKAIVPGTDHLTGGQADNIYFGTYQQSSDGNGGFNIDPIKWRVLSNADGKLFLLADQNLDVQKYHRISRDTTWEQCTLRTWMNETFYNTAFSQNEQTYIAETTNENTDNKTQDKVFALSHTEANDSAYFPDGNDSRKGTNTAYAGNKGAYGGTGTGEWWLRSLPYSGGSEYAYSVKNDGSVINGTSVTDVLTVRPAFNLNLNSVLFSSAAVDSKPGGKLQKIKDYTGNEWKLTLLDDNRDDFSFGTTKVDGNTRTVAYSGAVTGTNEYLSVLIEDNGEYTHYGRLKQLADGDESGTVEIDLTGIDMVGKTLWLFNEQCNNDKMTDYASELKQVDMERNAYTITNNLTDVTTSNTATYRMMNDSTAYTATLTPASGYILPDSITVTMGGSTLTAGQDYTYENGEISISSVSGDIEITASGTPATYIISVTGDGSFAERHIGYTDAPDAATFTLTNDGNSQVTGLFVALVGSGFTLTQPAKTTLDPNDTTTFTVQPDTELGAGTHEATVNITGDKDATANVRLSFIVSGHKFTNYVSDGNATCTQDGTKTAKCDYQGCAETHTQTEDMLGHDYQKTVTDPTCTTGGYTTHTCSRCPNTYTDSETVKLGHDFENWQEITSPSCEGDGQRQRKCTRCSVTETENIDPTGHKWENSYTIDQAATCTADGSKSIHCEKCTVTKDSEVIPKTGHSYTNYAESSDATCTESGTKTAACDNGCGETSVVADSNKPKLGHDFSIKGNTTPPTCTGQGFTIYQCSRCTETQKGDLIPISGHTPGDAATCTTDQTCTVCGEVLTAKLGHTGGTATCIAQASCTRCGVAYGDKNSSNHTGGEEVRGKTEATTTSEGYTGDTYCLGCGEKIATGKTIPKLPDSGGGGWDYTPPTYINRTLSKDGVTVTGSSIHRYATLTVDKDRLHNSGDCESCEQIREWQGQSRAISIYDVALSHSFRGTVTITFPVSSEYNGKTLTVAHCLKNKLETYDVTVSNGKVTVTVSSLSPFAILDNSKDEPGKENPDTGVTNPFTDVGETSWFFNDVMFVYEKGLMAGTSATTFSPGSNTTRAQLAVIFYRMEGSPKVEGQNGFTDVEYGPGTAWYYDAVTWAKQSGVVSGYGNGTFGPGNPITREQLAAIFYRYAQYKGYDVTAAGSLDRFTDKEKVSPWAKKALTWAVSSGIVNGTGSSQLSPQGTATRAQIAAMLHRFVDWYEQEERQNVTTTR